MNQTRLNSARLRRLMLAPSCALLAVSLATAQQTTQDPVRAAQDAQALAKYDTNKNGTLDPSERAAMEAATSSTSTTGEDVLLLSPFQVDASKDKGYFAENTLAGSRMKTNLSDLGASISVVTKAQMEDFASVDVNDVFRYEVNTEGSSTYTPQTQAFRNDGILDINAGGTQGNAVVSLTNAQANRVRGLGVPSASTNFYPSNAAVPPDSYNVQSYEISRGPNSMLFGLGSPAGIVNQTTSQAALNRDSNRVELRGDDRGSFRSSLSINRSIIKDKLAVYAAVLYDDRQFQRKPSYDITRRQYAAITYKPFSKTTLRANFENYNNDNRRPNTVSPIDFVTQWNAAGRPTYDALTKKVTFLSNGRVVGPFLSSERHIRAQEVRDYIIAQPGFNPALRGGNTSSNTDFNTYNGVTIFGTLALTTGPSATSTGSILYVPGISQVSQARALMQIGNGQLQNWFQPLYTQNYRTAYNNPSGGAENTFPINTINATTQTATTNTLWLAANADWQDVYNRDYLVSQGWTNNSALTNVGGYRYPGITDRAIYDWKDINVNQANWGEQKNKNFNFEFEQELTRELFFNAGWFRQVFEQKTNYTIAQLNATAVRIDVNKYLPNGTPNPYFGLPFVTDQDPDRYVNTSEDDHFKAMLAYTPDFTRRDGWMKWLGHHQILGLWSRDEYMSLSMRQRLNYVGAGDADSAIRYLTNPNNNAAGQRTGWAFGGATQRNFYLANPGDPMGQVTRSSGEWNALDFTGNIQVYDYAARTFKNANVTETFNTFDSPGRSQRILQSWSGGMTNYFWKDRVVTTFGARVDKFKARNTTTGTITLPSGIVIPQMTPQERLNADGTFNTGGIMNRFNPYSYTVGRTKTGGGVVRPFRGWESIDNRANNGNHLWQFIRDLGISYNWSDNFDVPSGVQVDAFGAKLPNPQGIGKDIGIQFSALDNKLFARVTWFEATNTNQRVAAGTAINRITGNIDTTLFRNWARTIAQINMGRDPTATNPTLTPAEELQVQAAAEVIWKQPYNYYGNLPGTITATGDAVAKGIEAQLNYNTGNWRNRVTFGKQTTVNSNVLKQFDAWFAHRNPVWQAARASDYLLPQFQNFATYTTATGTVVDLRNFWSSYGYVTEVRQNEPNGNTDVAAYYGSTVAPQVRLSKDLDGQAAPNQRKYRLAYNTGYDFSRSGWLQGVGIGGAQRWESKSVIGYFGKASGGTTGISPVLDISDTTRPIYDEANYYTDLFVKYRRKILRDRVTMTIQLNIDNVFESGSLQTTAVNYDGSPYGFRIIDPRTFKLTSTFEF
jgi:hypothetical protein